VIQQFPVWQKYRHSSRDAGIQSQGREASNLQQALPLLEVCHPWTLDSGIPAGMTGVFHRVGSKMRIANGVWQARCLRPQAL